MRTSWSCHRDSLSITKSNQSSAPIVIPVCVKEYLASVAVCDKITLTVSTIIIPKLAGYRFISCLKRVISNVIRPVIGLYRMPSPSHRNTPPCKKTRASKPPKKNRRRQSSKAGAHLDRPVGWRRSVSHLSNSMGGIIDQNTFEKKRDKNGLPTITVRLNR